MRLRELRDFDEKMRAVQGANTTHGTDVHMLRRRRWATIEYNLVNVVPMVFFCFFLDPGTIAEVKEDPEEEPPAAPVMINNNNNNNNNISNNTSNEANIMNNGSRDTSNSDIQKLQQQLQDIKEQVCRW